jgi:hypothetical protein
MCTTFSKGCLILVNAFFFVVGAALIFLGAWTFAKYTVYGHGFVTLSASVLPALLLLVIGVLAFMLGLIGCFATFKDQKCLTGLFFTLLLLIFVGLVTGAFLSYFYHNMIDEDLHKMMKENMDKYFDDEIIITDVDIFQTEFKCCGVDNYTDWKETAWYKNQSDPSHAYPDSCCFNNTCEYSHPDPMLHPQGCYVSLKNILVSHFVVIAAVAGGFAIILLIGMVFSCVLLIKKRRRVEEIPYIGISDPDGMRV